MTDNVNFFLLTLTSFFTIVNPISTMPVFMTMTGNLNQTERRNTAMKAILIAFFTILAFALSGQLLFEFFGISVHGFRVVGGVIFFMMGYDMLQARLSTIKVAEGKVKEYVTDISVTPLAIPMICGPGAITNGIVLMEDANSSVQIGLLVLGIAIVCLASFLVLWGAGYITEKLGETGNKVMMRLMGLIIMVIAVEFFFSGIKPILIEILKSSAV